MKSIEGLITKFKSHVRSALRKSRKLDRIRQVIRLRKWFFSGFSSPAPNYVKWKVLNRWGGKNTWIETGTYLGETTSFLAKFANTIYSLEPEKSLFYNASKYFETKKNVKIIWGSSEEILPNLVKSLSDQEIDDVSFWLDGHYSAGITFLGERETPIVFELNLISKFLNKFSKVTIFVDDVRQFSKSDDDKNQYPSLSFLASYADTNGLYWIIEHDIFIMTNRTMP
jgi:hypothetical protein